MWRRKGLPEGWLDIVEQNVAIWGRLDDDERGLLEGTSDWLLRHKHWEAAHGFELHDDVVVTIAALAAYVVLGRTLDEYREVSAIIVYPTAMLSRGVYAGPVSGTVTDGGGAVLGEAHDARGPVILAWDQARDAARHPGRGHNVVFHEFAHKIDMLDGTVNGTPPLAHRAEVERWTAVALRPTTALRAGVDRPPLQPYGATNPAEFFAVATEAFFDVPTELEHHEPQPVRDHARLLQPRPGRPRSPVVRIVRGARDRSNPRLCGSRHPSGSAPTSLALRGNRPPLALSCAPGDCEEQAPQRARHRRIRVVWLGIGALLGALLGANGGKEGSSIATGVAIAAIFAGVAVAFAIMSGGRLVLAVSGAKPADPHQYHQLHDVVEAMSISAGLPKPAVYVIEDPSPNGSPQDQPEQGRDHCDLWFVADHESRGARRRRQPRDEPHQELRRQAHSHRDARSSASPACSPASCGGRRCSCAAAAGVTATRWRCSSSGPACC